MSFEQKKQNLLNELQSVKNMVLSLDFKEIHKQINELIKDIEHDFHTVVVVGEFKNGKSTFINALLQESLLPVDVTPTTATINAVMWGEERRLEVHKSDQTVEKLALTQDALEKYVAEKDFDPDTIRYLKISMPAPLLANKNVVLVDTPGVNDLNSHRSDVTYQFIPKADVVLFMLDMTAPVKGTEKEFLQETLLKEGLERIIFLANFKDLVDEEEVEEVLTFTKNRLADILGYEDVKIYPIAAQDAIDAMEDDDSDLHEWSGLPQVQSVIEKEMESGNQSEVRWNRYLQRSAKIYDAISKLITQKQLLSTQTKEELQKEWMAIKENYTKKEDYRYKIEQYVLDRENEFMYMLHKSIDSLSSHVKEEMEIAIKTYKGTDIKDYVEEQLPIFMKKHLKRWVDEHIDQIHNLLYKLEKALAEGLTREFNAHIQLKMEQNQLLKTSGRPFEISVDDISNTSVLAGLIAGGAGALMMVVGGPILLPIIGMAGYPILQKKLVEKRLNEAKTYLLSEIGPTLDGVLNSFRMEVEQYMKTNIRNIEISAIEKFDEQLEMLQRNVEAEIKLRQHDQKGILANLTHLDEVMEYLQILQGKRKEKIMAGVNN
ncbi:dynamin family protein [Rossellomorea aquimaris]|uniref:dynamin family protein n=1 Tax=Rossellomorea aquimaris TaxID=189382 RepID=UPI001CFC64D8|nr:dynamin family protein [Rossellomorea aquimaris]